MSSVEMFRRRVRRPVRLAVALGVSLGLVVAGSGPGSARDQRYPVRGAASIAVIGHGYGHGRGMSQWGAYGAATKGLTYSQILAFYYQGTTLTTTVDPPMRVLISADNDNATNVLPSPGLAVCHGANLRTGLLASSAISSWRLVMISGVLRLQYFSAGAYHTSGQAIGGTSALFTSSSSCTSLGAATVTLLLPGGARMGVRAGVRAVVYGTGVRTVGVMGMTSYLASVVPSEMPSGWAPEALKAQSVAARSYATRYREVSGGPTKQWDICDTTACQVFHGTSAEAASTTAAVAATADRVLTYGGAIALTEFSASNGGWTTSGGSSAPYLVAKADPYDGVVASYGASWPNPHTWTDTISAAGLQSHYPIGTLVRIDVTGRDGNGDFGGRTTSVVVQGTTGHVTLTGSEFASAAGLKSIWWTTRFGGLDHDLTNDGRPDIAVRDHGGVLRIYPGDGAGSFGVSTTNGTGWGGMDQIMIGGDLTGDGTSDIVGRNATTGAIVVYPGNAAGWITGGSTLATGSYSMMAAPGDFNGDGHADLLGVDSTTGDLQLLRGDGAGGFAAPIVVGHGWDIFDTVIGAGDLNGDGYVDVVARVHSTGQLRIYYGDGHGGWATPVTLPGSYIGLSAITIPGDLTGDGRPDLVGINAATGALARYPGTSTGFGFGTVIWTTGWAGFDRLA